FFPCIDSHCAPRVKFIFALDTTNWLHFHSTTMPIIELSPTFELWPVCFGKRRYRQSPPHKGTNLGLRFREEITNCPGHRSCSYLPSIVPVTWQMTAAHIVCSGKQPTIPASRPSDPRLHEASLKQQSLQRAPAATPPRLRVAPSGVPVRPPHGKR
uniref:BRCT domain-containing protein n=1 Tax=Mesocestoides corti TaxID=53468 RepID=A0A5K3EHT9_MESCO